MVRFVFLASCLFSLIALPFCLAQESAYVLTDLGRVGDLSSEANAISDTGVVVGSIQISSQGTPRQRAFYFYEGVRSFDYFGGSEPNRQSKAIGVNAAGCAVGWTQAADLAPIYLGVWKAADSCPFDDAIYLIDLGGGKTAGLGVNDSHRVTGYSLTGDSDESHAAAITLGTVDMADLGVLPGGWSSAAWEINRDGISVGYSSSAASVQVATRWDSDSPSDLGAFAGSTPGTTSYALAINDLPSPQIVGWSHGPQAVGHPHAFLWEGGVMEDLGTLAGGDWSEAFDINDHGTVVGWARTVDFFSHAVLWNEGSIQDLNDVAGIPSGWVLAEARGINNSGQIVGRGAFDAMDRAFLLTPVLFGDGFEDGTLNGWDGSAP